MVWEFPDDEWCDCSESESTVFMGAQGINPPQDPQYYQLSPEIKSLDPTKTPTGGIDLRPFSAPDNVNASVAKSMQRSFDLQKANVDAYNKDIIEQQQKIIDAENQKIRAQNQARIADYEKNSGFYAQNPNFKPMATSERFKTPEAIDYSQYTPYSPQPLQGQQPNQGNQFFLARQQQQQMPRGREKYKAPAPVENPFSSGIFKNPTFRM